MFKYAFLLNPKLVAFERATRTSMKFRLNILLWEVKFAI